MTVQAGGIPPGLVAGRAADRLHALGDGLRTLIDEPRRARWLVLAALLAGIAVRVSAAPDVEFSGDLGLAYEDATPLAHGVSFPVLGAQASWGGRVPFPGYYYVVAVPLALTRSPLVWIGWGALLCGLGLVPFALLLWERYGPRVAVFGAWLAATAPWLVLFGDSTWSPDLSLPCTAFELYVVHRMLARPGSRWAFWLFPAFTVHAHLYPNLPVALAMALGMVAAGRPRIAWRWLALGLLPALLTVAPSLLYLARHGAGAITRPSQPQGYDAARDLVNALYGCFACATAETAFWLKRGYWYWFDVRSWAGGLPASLRDTFGWGWGGYVAANVFATLGAWLWVAGRGVAALFRRPRPGLDPLAGGLLAGLAMTVLLVVGLHQRFLPRYGIVIAWLSFVPVLLLVRRPGRAAVSAALWVALLVAVPANYLVTRLYYDRVVPPYGARTVAEAVDTIRQEQGSRPFELSSGIAKVTLAAHRLGSAEYGATWRKTERAAVEYVLLPAAERMAPDQRRLLAQPGARVHPLYRGVLLRRPGHLPAAPRRPPPAPAAGGHG